MSQKTEYANAPKNDFYNVAKNNFFISKKVM